MSAADQSIVDVWERKAQAAGLPIPLTATIAHLVTAALGDERRKAMSDSQVRVVIESVVAGALEAAIGCSGESLLSEVLADFPITDTYNAAALDELRQRLSLRIREQLLDMRGLSSRITETTMRIVDQDAQIEALIRRADNLIATHEIASGTHTTETLGTTEISDSAGARAISQLTKRWDEVLRTLKAERHWVSAWDAFCGRELTWPEIEPWFGHIDSYVSAVLPEFESASTADLRKTWAAVWRDIDPQVKSFAVKNLRWTPRVA